MINLYHTLPTPSLTMTKLANASPYIQPIIPIPIPHSPIQKHARTHAIPKLPCLTLRLHYIY